jgi:hypothetical protein
MLGFTDRLTTIIQGLRVEELCFSIKFRKLLILRIFLGSSPIVEGLVKR